MIADYAFYTLEYHGTLTGDAFGRLSVRAAAYLDTLTMGRINRPDLPAPVAKKAKLALCACVDELAEIEAGPIASESNDGVSVTFSRTGESDEQRLYRAAADYLTTTGLLYRGCCF